MSSLTERKTYETADGFELEVEHGPHVIACKKGGELRLLAVTHLHGQPSHTLARRAKVQLGQPIIGILEGLLPFLHQTQMQAG